MEKETLSRLMEATEDTNRKVGQIHTTIFGAEGQGGLIRDHKEFKAITETELAALKKHKEEINIFKAKLLGMVGGVSLVSSFLGSKIASAIFKIP